MIGIYKIISPKKKIYVGQSVNIKKRFSSYKRLECEGQTKLYNSLKKHGFENHKKEILCECKRDELNDLETYYIELYQCLNSDFGLNLREGGHLKLSVESRNKIREKLIGRKLSLETIEKIRLASTGRKHSEKSKKKMSESKKGKIVSEQGRINISNSVKGRKASQETKNKKSIAAKIWRSKPEVIAKYLLVKLKPLTEETKKKISESNKGKTRSEQTKEKLRKSHIGRKYFGKKILDTKTGITYDSTRYAAQAIGMNTHTLNNHLRGITVNKTDFIYVIDQPPNNYN